MAESANVKDEWDLQTEKIQERMDKISRKILIMSGKGGVFSIQI